MKVIEGGKKRKRANRRKGRRKQGGEKKGKREKKETHSVSIYLSISLVNRSRDEETKDNQNKTKRGTLENKQKQK